MVLDKNGNILTLLNNSILIFDPFLGKLGLDNFLFHCFYVYKHDCVYKYIKNYIYRYSAILWMIVNMHRSSHPKVWSCRSGKW